MQICLFIKTQRVSLLEIGEAEMTYIYVGSSADERRNPALARLHEEKHRKTLTQLTHRKPEQTDFCLLGT